MSQGGITCELVPGIMPVTNFRQMTGFRRHRGAERAPLDGHPVRGDWTTIPRPGS